MPIELNRYRQSGKVALDENTVTQHIGRGRTAEDSLGQLATHSKDPEYLQYTITYAANVATRWNSAFTTVL